MRPLLAAAGILLAFGLPPPATGTATAKPALRIEGHALLGVRFSAREQVRISFIADTTRVSRLTTNASGSFTMPLPSLASCLRPLTVKAVGASGDAAVLRVPNRACMPR